MKASSIPKLVSTMVLVVFGCSRIAKGKEEAMELESKKDHDMAEGVLAEGEEGNKGLGRWTLT
jgi:hypothetical protein